MFNFCQVPDEEFRKMGLPEKWTSCYTASTLVVEQKYYMKWLHEKLVRLSVNFEQRKLSSLDEVHGYDAVINCSGLGAAALLGDKEMYPIRGQVLRVKAPWIKNVWMFGPNYLIPNVDSVVVGGTQQRGNWSEAVSVEDTKAIIEAVASVFPSIRSAPIVREVLSTFN
jgi:hypothetical protein